MTISMRFPHPFSSYRVLDCAATTLVAAFCLCSISCAKTPNPQEEIQTVAAQNRVVRRVVANKVATEKTSSQTVRARKIVAAARAQVDDLYDQSYISMPYPNGDVPRGRGACTDVIIRSLRAVGHDLQALIHNDKRRFPVFYPRKNQHQKLDKNIDHRRVPNQKVFLTRFGSVLTTQVDSSTRSQWKAGDIVQWKFDNGLDHTGIISDKTNARGWPLIIHNVGGCQENDVLTTWKIVAHFRFPKR